MDEKEKDQLLQRIHDRLEQEEWFEGEHEAKIIIYFEDGKPRKRIGVYKEG